MRIQRTMKIVAACAALAGSAAVLAADIPIKGTPCTGKWVECDAPRSALEKPGWKLTFSDDFDKPRLRDKNWFTSYRAGRKDWFARMGIPSRFDDPDAHYVIEDGILKLRIDRDLPRRKKPSAPAVSSIQTCDYRIRATTNDIQRLDKFAQKYGWWEVRCRMPKGDGLHAAFWLVQADPAGAVSAGRASEVRGLAEAHAGRPSLPARLRDRLRARLRPRVNGGFVARGSRLVATVSPTLKSKKSLDG